MLELNRDRLGIHQGADEPEYKEAKEILESKFGGQRRQLRAYMDQLEKMA